MEQIRTRVPARGVRASNELRTSALLVLRGSRHGRSYIVSGTGRVKYRKRDKTATITYRRYTASAPGEPPAVRTGNFRLGWLPRTLCLKRDEVISRIENNATVGNGKYVLGRLLEDGTSRMAARPHQEKIAQKALPGVMRIYKEPYE